jgi:hypothetical protein
MIGFIETYTSTQFGTTDNCSVICYSTHFQFTVIHVLVFSVFTSRILATDLSQSHYHLNSHMTSSWHSLIPFLPFPAAAISEDSAQFSSDYCSVLLQLLNSQFQFCNLVSLATNGLDPVENTVFYGQVLLCYLVTRWSWVHREHSSYYCVFAGTCILSRCLAMGRYVTIWSWVPWDLEPKMAVLAKTSSDLPETEKP